VESFLEHAAHMGGGNQTEKDAGGEEVGFHNVPLAVSHKERKKREAQNHIVTNRMQNNILRSQACLI
jgi:hypothetical protein